MGFFIGLVIGVIVILYVNARSAKRKEVDRLSQYEDMSQPISIPTATIAKDLKPLFENIVCRGTLIEIVGDGFYSHSPNKKYWKKCLKSWLDAGAAIDYFLIDPQPNSVSELINIFEDVDGEARIFVVDTTSVVGEISEIAALFQTLHPVLVRNSSEVWVWLERYHPRNSCYSYGNLFLPPNSELTVKKHRLYAGYLKTFRRHITPVFSNVRHGQLEVEAT